jgi:hypothetical protein
MDKNHYSLEEIEKVLPDLIIKFSNDLQRQLRLEAFMDEQDHIVAYLFELNETRMGQYVDYCIDMLINKQNLKNMFEGEK